MGIKGWLVLGGLALTGVMTWLGFNKKEDERLEKIMDILKDVDLKKEPEKEEQTEEIIDDIQQALDDIDEMLGVEEDEDKGKKEPAKTEDVKMPENIATNLNSIKKWEVADEIRKVTNISYDQAIMLEHVHRMTNDMEYMDGYMNWLKNCSSVTASMNNVDRIKMWRIDWLMADPEYQEMQKKQKEQLEKEEHERWLKEVAVAVERKNFHKLEDLFDEAYAGGPWHPSPASVFGNALNAKVIDTDLYKEAQQYFGRLWNYSGD